MKFDRYLFEQGLRPELDRDIGCREHLPITMDVKRNRATGGRGADSNRAGATSRLFCQLPPIP
jgi:hypothetical protein